MEIKKVLIVGGGAMGRQIGLNTAIYGIETVVYDLIPACLTAVDAWSKEYLAGRVAKGKMTQEAVDAALKLFSVEGDLEKATKDVDLVIEAIIENEDAKRDMFKKLDKLCPAKTIFASNSSFLVSSKFKNDVSRPDKLANMHFYNPALVMKFVEVCCGEHTSEETAQTLMAYCNATGKKAILMKKELRGFAANYIVSAMNGAARHLVAGGYCTPQEVDMACELGLGHPMGPFRMLDFSGVDVTFGAMQSKWKEEGVKPEMYDEVEAMVKAGKLGKKAGEGFYKYDK